MMHWPRFRDISLFVGGLAGVAHETLLSHAERPTLLILFAAMMGLPAFLRPQEAPQPATTVIVENKEDQDQKQIQEHNP